MTDLVISNAATMSSREIAELVAARHNDVVATIDRLFGKGLLRSSRESRQEATGGRPIEVYDLIERDCYLVVSGYSDELRAKVIDRWQELEESAVPKIPKTLSGALRLAAEQAEQIEQQQAALAIAAPKVEFHDRYAAADTGSKGFREVCKLLKANEREFRDWLMARGIMYRLSGVLTPYAAHLDAERFETKAGVSQHSEHAFNQYRFTPKGVAWVAGEWAKHNVTRIEAAIEQHGD